MDETSYWNAAIYKINKDKEFYAIKINRLLQSVLQQPIIYFATI